MDRGRDGVRRPHGRGSVPSVEGWLRVAKGGRGERSEDYRYLDSRSGTAHSEREPAGPQLAGQWGRGQGRPVGSCPAAGPAPQRQTRMDPGHRLTWLCGAGWGGARLCALLGACSLPLAAPPCAVRVRRSQWRHLDPQAGVGSGAAVGLEIQGPSAQVGGHDPAPLVPAEGGKGPWRPSVIGTGDDDAG